MSLSTIVTQKQEIDYFAVREGTPMLEALEKVSALLAVAQEIAAQQAIDANTNAAWAPKYLIEMSKALLDAVIAGIPMGSDLPDAGL